MATIFSSYVGDDSTHTVDIVCHDYAAEGFDEDEANCLSGVGCNDIPKADRKHNVCGPVVGPYILVGPFGVVDALVDHPVRIIIYASHRSKHDAYHVSHTKINQKHLRQLPVLFVVEVANKVDLQLLYL